MEMEATVVTIYRRRIQLISAIYDGQKLTFPSSFFCRRLSLSATKDKFELYCAWLVIAVMLAVVVFI